MVRVVTVSEKIFKIFYGQGFQGLLTKKMKIFLGPREQGSELALVLGTK